MQRHCNSEVGAIHPKAMPVILMKPDEWETWLSAEWPAPGKHLVLTCKARRGEEI